MIPKSQRDEWRKVCDAANAYHSWDSVAAPPTILRWIGAARTALPACLDALDDAERRIAELEATLLNAYNAKLGKGE